MPLESPLALHLRHRRRFSGSRMPPNTPAARTVAPAHRIGRARRPERAGSAPLRSVVPLDAPAKLLIPTSFLIAKTDPTRPLLRPVLRILLPSRKHRHEIIPPVKNDHHEMPKQKGD